MRKFGKNQNGIISIFVMVSMLFFLTTIVGVYIISAKRAQTQTKSIQLSKNKMYERDEEEIYEDRISTSNDVPVCTKEQLYFAGTNKTIEVDGKVYKCKPEANYVLKNDIVINIEELTGSTFDESSITLQKDSYEIYYYYNNKYYFPTTGTGDYMDSNGNNYVEKNVSN